MLQIKDLNFSFKKQNILHNINMIADQGEIVAREDLVYVKSF